MPPDQPPGHAFPSFAPAWLRRLGKPAALAVVLQTAILAAAILLALVGQFWQSDPKAMPAVACGSIVGLKKCLLALDKTAAAGR